MEETSITCLKRPDHSVSCVNWFNYYVSVENLRNSYIKNEILRSIQAEGRKFVSYKRNRVGCPDKFILTVDCYSICIC